MTKYIYCKDEMKNILEAWCDNNLVAGKPINIRCSREDILKEPEIIEIEYPSALSNTDKIKLDAYILETLGYKPKIEVV